MPGKVWGEITYPFLNFNGATVIRLKKSWHPFQEGLLSWASYQIRKTVGCVYAGNARNIFPAIVG